MERTADDVIADVKDAVRGESDDDSIRVPVRDLRLLLDRLT